MEENQIEFFNDIKLDYTQNVADYKEVALMGVLPEVLKLNDCSLTVRIYEDDSATIFLYDFEEERFRDELWFNDEVEKEIIGFARNCK